MPRATRPWFRFYVEAFPDRKIRRLTPAQRWVWVAILGAARTSPVPGSLFIAPGVPMTMAELAEFAGVREREAADTVKISISLGMVEVVDGVIRAINWDHRQYESDNVTDRTRAHRERSKEPRRNVPRNDVGTHQKTETEADRPLALAPPPRERLKDELFEAVIAACGINSTEITQSQRGSLNGALKQLRDVKADPGQVPARALVFARKWPGVALTPPALAKHWAACDPGLRPTGTAPSFWSEK